jgi:cytochrome P450
MRDASDAFSARLAALTANGPATVDVDVGAMHFAGDVIFRTLSSEPMSERDAREIFAAFERFQRVVYAHGFLSLLGWPTFLLPSNWRGRRDARFIRRALERPIARRFDKIARGEPTPDNDILAALNILAALISGVDPVMGSRFRRSELLIQSAILFLAGHET